MMTEQSPNLFAPGQSGEGLQGLGPRVKLTPNSGIFSRQRIFDLIKRKKVKLQNGSGFADDQVQPASLDLRLGAKAYRVRASFLPGTTNRVDEQLGKYQLHEISLEDGAILERDCVYVIELQEVLDLPESVRAFANPKSSTGRLDIFTRLITDHCEVFDYIEAGYSGKLYAEVSPRTFSIKVQKGVRLNQLRFQRRIGQQDRNQRSWLSDKELRELHKKEGLVDCEPTLRNGLNVRVDLRFGSKGKAARDKVIGYRAQRFTEIVDVSQVNEYEIADFWEPVYANSDGSLILDPQEFYILASKEALHIPPLYAAEMIPVDPMMGEFRAHYAGFFDPGFGNKAAGGAGSKAVLEVRSHDVPFVLNDGQIIARLAFEELTEEPDIVYGRDLGSNYQSQGLKLSKHFKQPVEPKVAVRKKASVAKKKTASKAAAPTARKKAPVRTPASKSPAAKQTSVKKAGAKTTTAKKAAPRKTTAKKTQAPRKRSAKA